MENERAMWVALEQTHRREERQRLASELHDSVSQALFSMNLHTRALQLAVQQRRGDSLNTVARGLTWTASDRDAGATVKTWIPCAVTKSGSVV